MRTLSFVCSFTFALVSCILMYRFEKSRGKITNLDWLTQLVSAANKEGKFLKKLRCGVEGRCYKIIWFYVN